MFWSGRAAYGNEDLREYCQLETFSPRCRHGDVIVMTTARFGRMRVGKCIDLGAQSTLHRADPYSLGCFADVLDYADRVCSGRSSCDIPVPTRELLSTKPCFEQLTMYLEAGYTCMSGENNNEFRVHSVVLYVFTHRAVCRLLNPNMKRPVGHL